jgi:hypothetical protein
MRMLEQGPESQAASLIRAGGVSAVISSSDLGALSIDREDPFGIGVKAHCPQR